MNVFLSTAPGITPYLQADADLVMEAKRLLNATPITIIAEWVKGYYNGKDREFKHDLNEITDSLATDFNSSPHPNHIVVLQINCAHVHNVRLPIEHKPLQTAFIHFDKNEYAGKDASPLVLLLLAHLVAVL